jgi:hypothetical protein
MSLAQQFPNTGQLSGEVLFALGLGRWEIGRALKKEYYSPISDKPFVTISVAQVCF